MSRKYPIMALVAAAAAVAATFVTVGRADSPPVGGFPNGPTSLI
jgi:hypothetical protein